ncbi:hypothetical protein BHC46_06220 [Snodgrassella alvi]|uniref:Uncharacterized protein n=1 Tax=Snodgrassella alvi TaxID=1196083 RepID=A0A2N9XHR5_9NEIS|nr:MULTISPECIES: hypothetical protein [Snodgrassella]PIT47870.1 hypothetical protein BHC46_06220 [Snodgrassella alvi]SCB83685.1 hypothetical protein GA0061082_102129 [Snodgrassella sp. R-53583]
MKQNEIKDLICLIEKILADKSNTISDPARKELESFLLQLKEDKSKFSLLPYLNGIAKVMDIIEVISEAIEKYFS